MKLFRGAFVVQFSLKMWAKDVILAVLGSFAIALAKDYYVSDRKILGGNLISCDLLWTQYGAVSSLLPNSSLNPTCFLDSGNTPGTVASKEWREETDQKFQAWPRTAGPPVVMSPISRQSFMVMLDSK